MDTARPPLFLYPAALAARQRAPQRLEREHAEPAPSGWHESSWDLRAGLTVVEEPLPDAPPRPQ